MRTILVTLGLLAACLCLACGGKKPAPAQETPEESIGHGAKRLGQTCLASAECGKNLTCMEGVCTVAKFAPTTEELRKAYELGHDRADKAIEGITPYQNE